MLYALLVLEIIREAGEVYECNLSMIIEKREEGKLFKDFMFRPLLHALKKIGFVEWEQRESANGLKGWYFVLTVAGRKFLEKYT